MSGQNNESNQPASTASTFGLSNEEIDFYSKKSKQGDKDAAFKLYEYYSLVALDPQQAQTWLAESAALGHPVAQYNLSITYLQQGRKKEAAFWAGKAASNRVALSNEELCKLVQKCK
ncbi:MAG: sel1 repeat family protein [Neisseria sp.]|nr:sel1 repeat family protein [Neisseria sp.]